MGLGWKLMSGGVHVIGSVVLALNTAEALWGAWQVGREVPGPGHRQRV